MFFRKDIDEGVPGARQRVMDNTKGICEPIR